MGVLYNSRIVTDGLVLCLDAGDRMSYPGAGTTWTDLTANKNNGTFTNMTSSNFNAGNAGSLTFDGSNEHVNCGPTNDIIGNNPAAISLSAWFKTDNNSHAFYIASLKRLSNSTLVSITINQAGDVTNNTNFIQNYLGFLYDIGDSGGDTGGGHKWLTVNNSTFYGKWNQITATVDVNAGTLYLNGVQVKQDTTNTFAGPSRDDPSGDFTIGAFAASYGSLFANANISQVHVYNRVLSAQEIKQNYKATKGRFGL